MGHQQGEAAISGKNIMMSLDCKSCHKEAETSIGPSFIKVAEKYAKDPNASTYLSQKIIKGGGGVWGEVAMAAHPTLAQNDVHQIVQWVLSLSNKDAVKKSLAPSGSIIPTAGHKPNEALVLSASYTDKGGNNIKALTGRSSVALRSSFLQFTAKENVKGYTMANYDGTNYMVIPTAEGWFAVDSIDLTGIQSVNAMAGWQQPPAFGYDFEIRLDDANGKLLGKGSLLPPTDKKQQMGAVHFRIEPVSDHALHTLYIISRPRDSKEKAVAGIGALQFGGK